jgi:subtilisin family serine protease
MERMYTVLLDSATRTGGRRCSPTTVFDSPFELATRLTAEPPRPALHREKLTLQELQELAQEPDFVAAAEIMRTRLVTPTENGEVPAGPKCRAGSPRQSWGIAAIGADRSPFTGAGATVAVLDSGIDAKHPAFCGLEIIEKDFSETGHGDCNGHGTYCAGIAFGRNVGGIRIGVAPGVRRALIGKIVGPAGGDTGMLFRAVSWAYEQQAQVIATATDLDFMGSVEERVRDGWPERIAIAATLDAYWANRALFRQLLHMLELQEPSTGGTLVVAAAGSDSHRGLNGEFVVPACLPASCDRIVSVGAFDPDSIGLGFSVSGDSNSGASISAPGRDILSAAPGGGLRVSRGTGAACAHVAGIAALWWEALRENNRPANATTLRAHLLKGAERRGFAWSVTECDRGAGRVHAPQQPTAKPMRTGTPEIYTPAVARSADRVSGRASLVRH